MRFLDLRRAPLFVAVWLGIILYIFTPFDALFRLRITAAPPPTSQPDQNYLHLGTPRVILVSAFFPFNVSKHSLNDYTRWLSNFLGPITTDVYFYTAPEMEAAIRSARGNLPITINTTFSSPFEIPPLNGLRQKYVAMEAQDREKDFHSVDLYAIWNAKPYFLDEAIKNSGKEWDYAFWTDAGSFRYDHRYEQWPDVGRVEELWEQGSALTGLRKEDLFFFPLTGAPHPSFRHWQENMGPIDNDFSEGTFFGGKPSAVSWWSSVFYTYHDYYLSQHIFVGKDQTLINALFLLFPSRIISVWYGDQDAAAHQGLLYPFDQGTLGNCGDNWFYYQFFLTNDEGREKMRTIWEAQARWGWGWWKARQACRLTELLTVKELLRRQFGDSWNPPKRAVHIPGVD